jgi:hypothetical protein
LSGDKGPSLLQTCVNYGTQKSFIRFGPGRFAAASIGDAEAKINLGTILQTFLQTLAR